MNDRESYTHEEVKDMVKAVDGYHKASKKYGAFVMLGREDLGDQKKAAKEELRECTKDLVVKLPTSLVDLLEKR